MRLATIVLALSAAFTASVAHATTVSDFIEKQQSLNQLDYQIERFERLVKLKETKHKLATVGQEDAGKGASREQVPQIETRYFMPPGANPGALDPVLAAQEQKTEAELKRERRQQERASELSMLNDARILEVFRKEGRGSEYAAVLKLKDQKVQVTPGDMLSNWKVVRIGLSEVVLRNQKYKGAVRHLKQIL
ncbi:hypothetical protein [Marinobacter subterrani]|uniref:hypothetical protein n=1 Tax=Marinobacter subterrani TaxID=1658765 RepID=UPI002355071C|nr:hypothetical protein [Marinobacter subterrani]